MSQICIISAKVHTQNSQELLQFLAYHHFCIFRFDSFSKDLTPIDPSIALDNALDPKWFHFQCIYNGDVTPPQIVFERLITDTATISFTINVAN